MRRGALFTIVLLFAGCVGGPAATVGPADVDVPAFLAVDHDHMDPGLHEGARNMSLAAYLPVCDPASPCSFGEIDVMGDIALVAITEPDGGFALVDIAEPRAPKVLSVTKLGRTVATDVKLAPDGRTAFIAVSNWLPFVGKPGTTADPTSLAGAPTSQGIHVYDVADPAAPVSRWFEPMGAEGVHMLDVHVIDGEMFVFATTPAYFKFFLPGQTRGPIEPVVISRYDAASGRLERISEYVPPEAGIGTNGDSAHDITVVDDPDEGPLLFAAFAFGVAVARVADPAAPEHVGSWRLADEGFDASRNAHTVMMQRVEGVRTLVVTPEQLEENELYVVDATDLASMSLVSTWHLPGDLDERAGLEWSLHNVNLLDGKAYVAHYHGGVWVLDLSTRASLEDPRPLGHFATVETGQVGPGLPEVWAGPTMPNVWDVVPGKGVVFVSDITSGFYVLDAAWSVPMELPYGERGASLATGR